MRVVVLTGPKKMGHRGKRASRHEAPPQSIDFACCYVQFSAYYRSSPGIGRALTEVVLKAGHRVATSARQAKQLSDLRASHKNRLLSAGSLVHNCLRQAMNKFRLPQCLVSRLKAVSIGPTFLLRKSGLPPALCSSGDGMISPEQFFRLWHTLGEVSDDPTIGLRIGALNPRHPATIAAQRARAFRDALPHLARSAILNFSRASPCAALRKK